MGDKTQADIDRDWLDLTYRIVRAPKGSCDCDPTAGCTVRWSGYLGRSYANPDHPRRRFLFVGANHNPNGLAKTSAITDYNRDTLQPWASRDHRYQRGDDALLNEMRRAYQSSWPKWGAVWRIFTAIRDAVGIGADEFAFVNLARCPNPDPKRDNDAIKACQHAFPLRDLVLALDARVIFLAKGCPIGGDVAIPDETSNPNQTSGRYVVRYGNGPRRDELALARFQTATRRRPSRSTGRRRTSESASCRPA